MSDKQQLDEPPGPHSAQNAALDVPKPRYANSRAYAGSTRSASFPTDGNKIMTRFEVLLCTKGMGGQTGGASLRGRGAWRLSGSVAPGTGSGPAARGGRGGPTMGKDSRGASSSQAPDPRLGAGGRHSRAWDIGHYARKTALIADTRPLKPGRAMARAEA